jgi:hypothetical protein
VRIAFSPIAGKPKRVGRRIGVEVSPDAAEILQRGGIFLKDVAYFNGQ